jgi:hypothetical protein
MTRDPKTGRFGVKLPPSDWLREAALRKLGRSGDVFTPQERSVGDAWLRAKITDAQLGPAKPFGEAPPEDALLTPEQVAEAARVAGAEAGGFGGGPTGEAKPEGQTIDERVRQALFGGAG